MTCDIHKNENRLKTKALEKIFGKKINQNFSILNVRKSYLQNVFVFTSIGCSGMPHNFESVI